jgi:hypothetical protein
MEENFDKFLEKSIIIDMNKNDEDVNLKEIS